MFRLPKQPGPVSSACFCQSWVVSSQGLFTFRFLFKLICLAPSIHSLAELSTWDASLPYVSASVLEGAGAQKMVHFRCVLRKEAWMKLVLQVASAAMYVNCNRLAQRLADTVELANIFFRRMHVIYKHFAPNR